MKAVILEDYAIQAGDLNWSGVEVLVTLPATDAPRRRRWCRASGMQTSYS